MLWREKVFGSYEIVRAVVELLVLLRVSYRTVEKSTALDK